MLPGLLLAGCLGGESPLLPASTTAEGEIAPRISTLQRASDQEHQRLLAAFGGEYRAPRARAALDEVVQRLAKAGEGQIGRYEITILNSPVVNAFALPSGRLYVTRGLLALANDTSEIASVLAHEIAHVTARHAVERAEKEAESALVSQVVSQVLKDPGRGEAVRAGSKLSLAKFSRQQELTADQISVRNIARAGYDPYGAGRFLSTLGRNTAFRSSGQNQSADDKRLDILSSHPQTPERIAAVTATARQIAAPGIGERDTGRWLDAIEGLAYGDDPRDGVVRGRRYLNSALRIAFSAPEGFSLEAAQDMVIGVSANGAQALRFDSVTLKSGQTLESYVAAGWIEGIATTGIEKTEIGGLPAVLAHGRGSDWTFRLAAVQAGERVYRFILAARGGADPERQMRGIVDSFQVMTPAEAQAVRPMQLRLVTAGAGDTLASMAARMPEQDRPEALFQLINGLDRNGTPTSGQRYKIVAE
ncbi:M48 family metalloprotease [Bosea sp. (in: a-proteobacteria)]|uniref:M48 family metalloprotease n=1 Tax=Bosea sp. (in: a-proteobacteria) TaxID=1871050 RepID=UPI0026333F90|nr:M48 family metalloprotease [Bosea sp. (in: a-proteobacteria)]MCO5089427.1 M48 family metalloprotease [Bosea sp. (in: a-proteobacteria)]